MAEWEGQAECTNCQSDQFKLYFVIEDGKLKQAIAECECGSQMEIHLGKRITDA